MEKEIIVGLLTVPCGQPISKIQCELAKNNANESYETLVTALQKAKSQQFVLLIDCSDLSKEELENVADDLHFAIVDYRKDESNGSIESITIHIANDTDGLCLSALEIQCMDWLSSSENKRLRAKYSQS